MKFALVSDIHVDLNRWDWECLENMDPDVNTLVVAGDISNDVREASRWLILAKQRFTNVVWVAGNHDFYNLGFHQTRVYDREFEEKWPYPHDMPEMLDHYQRWSDTNGITFLHRNKVVIDGVTFVGATGWHDYRAGDPYSTEDQIKVWYEVLNDRTIPWQRGLIQPDHLKPFDAGVRDWEYIRDQIPMIEGPVVAVTHHIPNRRFLWQRPHDRVWTLLHGSFANTRMESIVDPKIRYWIYGHTHQRDMASIGPTTYVCNAKGYRGENDNWTPIVLEV
jgi:predicted phosphodiesterase